MLHLQFTRHQKHQHLQEHSRIIAHHLVDRLAAPSVEGEMQFLDRGNVQRPARPTGIASVSLLGIPYWSGWAISISQYRFRDFQPRNDAREHVQHFCTKLLAARLVRYVFSIGRRSVSDACDCRKNSRSLPRPELDRPSDS